MLPNYLCPHCDAHLKLQNSLLFVIESESTKLRSLIMLNVELGNFEIITCPSCIFEKGDPCNFYCPVCHHNLAAVSINPNLVHIFMVDKDKKKYDVYFSRIAGEYSTFKMEENNIIEKYGEHSSDYQDYFLAKLKTKKI